MNWGFLNSIFPSWMRDKSGVMFTDITSIDEWYSGKGNLEIAKEHPILTPALLFVSKLFSQAEFWVETGSGKKDESNWFIALLHKPNYYQTKEDFLESLMFRMIAEGKVAVYAKRTIGLDRPTSLHILDWSKIKFPENIDKILNLSTSEKKYKNTQIVYDESGENKSIRLGDLFFFYDLPNAMKKNKLEAASRLDGLKQALINTHDSLTAKNIILRTNGKEMISGDKKDGFPLTPDEKQEAERLINGGYGLSKSRKRSWVTKASVSWQSMHIALRDLGLDESVKVDGNMIYTALHIPKDILSLEAKKTTYNNFKESMVSYIQNEMQSSLNAVISVLRDIMNDKQGRLKGSYEHLPVMQFVLIEKYDGLSKKAKALNDLIRTGIPHEIALEMCGFDKGIKLEEVQMLGGNGETNNNSSNGGNSQMGTNDDSDE